MTRQRFAPIVCALIASVAWPVAGESSRPHRPELPAQLSDAEFWRLSQTFSERGGTFSSDNFISNEAHFQDVIPDLVSRVKADGVYLGVGPEQNFTYIAAVRPRLSFIVDVRRGNLHEHLLYKALFELSPTRADFLSRLFSRKRPDGLTSATPVDALFGAYRNIQASPDLYRQNFRAVIDHLNGVHRLSLSQDDVDGVEYVYRSAFYREGPELGYALRGSARMGQVPNYSDLMTLTDATGRRWSYLSTEDRYLYVRSLETRNLIVPVVGNFAGAKALRAVAAYVRTLGEHVNTFYLSNVEQYLRQDGIWDAFCGNVASMPLDETSTFIRSTRGGGPGGRGSGARGFPPAVPGGVNFVSSLGAMMTETRTCTVAR